MAYRLQIAAGAAILLVISTAIAAGSATSPGGLWGMKGSDIYNTNPGNVGIGIATPQAKLEVAGDAHIRDHLSVGTRGAKPPLIDVPFEVAGAAALQYYTPIARITATEGNAGLAISRGDEEDASQLFLGYVDVGWVIEDTGHQHRLDIGDGVGPILSLLPTDEAAGNVGIGITEPAARLHVAGSIRIDGDEGGEAGTLTLTDTVVSPDHLALPAEDLVADQWLKIYVGDEVYYLPLYK